MSLRRRLSWLFASLVLLVPMLGSGIIAQSTANKAVGVTPRQTMPTSHARSKNGPRGRSSAARWSIICPKVAGVPSPKDVLGHHIGEPKKLTYYARHREVLPGAGRRDAARQSDQHRQKQRRPRPRRGVRRRRRIDQEPRKLPRLSRPARRPAHSSPTRRPGTSSRKRSRSITCQAACTAVKSAHPKC